MKIDISAELMERIQHQVESGNYQSAGTVLCAAMQLLEEYEDKHEYELSIVRAMVREAEEDMEKGNYRVYTNENLHELFDEIKREGRLRAMRRKEQEEDERQQLLNEAAGN